jgi:LacI family transcriptional regulator
MAVTIKDVARESGVNISTVSRSLNGSYGVNKRTREKVLEVARRLDYRPNRVARGLATGRSNTVGLIVSDIRNPYFSEVARGAEDAAWDAGCDVVLCNSDLDPVKQMRYVSSLLEKRVDGIVVNSIADLSKKQQEQLAASGAPVVLLNRPPGVKAFSSISVENYPGGVLAANYLLELGHRRTAFLSGPKRHGSFTDRGRGFQEALLESGKAEEPVILNADQSFAGGYQMARQLLAESRKVTAVFAANDVIAYGLIRAAMEAGLRIPDDLSVIGFDDLEMSSILHPPLTTVHQPKYEVGRAAMEMLLARAHRRLQPEPEHRVLPVKLVIRESCSRAKS